MNLPTRYRPLKGVLLFCIIIAGFQTGWWVCAPVFRGSEVYNNATDFLAKTTFNSSAWFLHHILGWDFEIQEPNTFLFSDYSSFDSHTSTLDPGTSTLIVTRGCSGLKQLLQVFFLFLLFPGPWKHKVWFIPLSILIIHGVNIIRIIALCIILIYRPGEWQLSHDWIFRPIIYLAIFGEWLIWEQHFRKRKTGETGNPVSG